MAGVVRFGYCVSDGEAGAIRQLRAVGPDALHGSEEAARAHFDLLPRIARYRLFLLRWPDGAPSLATASELPGRPGDASTRRAA
ncbi:hypothetical protein [Microcystis phage Mwe-JY25]